MNEKNVFAIDFSTGKLVPLNSKGLLPIGLIVTYSDIANPRRRFVVIGETMGDFGYGQACVCEDGHTSQVNRVALEGIGGWNDTGEVLDREEIAAFLAMAQTEKQAIAEQKQTAKTAASIAKDKERAELLAMYPQLEREGASKKTGRTLGASNLRKLLKSAFPSTKFLVKSDSFSMGNSIDVSWMDGPTRKTVDAIVDRFQESDFDMMDDSTSYRNSVFTELFGGAKYAQVSRRITAPAFARAVAEIKAENWTGTEIVNWDLIEIATSDYDGSAHLKNCPNIQPGNGCYWLSDMISQKAYSYDLTA